MPMSYLLFDISFAYLDLVEKAAVSICRTHILQTGHEMSVKYAKFGIFNIYGLWNCFLCSLPIRCTLKYWISWLAGNSSPPSPLLVNLTVLINNHHTPIQSNKIPVEKSQINNGVGIAQLLLTQPLTMHFYSCLEQPVVHPKAVPHPRLQFRYWTILHNWSMWALWRRVRRHLNGIMLLSLPADSTSKCLAEMTVVKNNFTFRKNLFQTSFSNESGYVPFLTVEKFKASVRFEPSIFAIDITFKHLITVHSCKILWI